MSPQKVRKNKKKQLLLINSRAISNILRVLGFDLHSSSPKPVNFFGAQSSLGWAQLSFRGEQAVSWGGTISHLGGHKQSFGGHAPGMPPVALGLRYLY